MSFYRNGEGYYDPSAGAALSAIACKQRQERRHLAEIQKRGDYEELCLKFRQMAEERGFEFPGRIWLRDKKSGFIFKGK